MKVTNIILSIAVLAIVYSCGNSSNNAKRYNADSSTAIKPEPTKTEVPQIQLTVKSGEAIQLILSSEEIVEVKILSGKRDTNFTVFADDTKVNYLSDDTVMIIHGNITKLDCSYNDEKVRALNLSKNQTLTQLHCSYNRIKELDVSNNANLEVLDCMDNDFEYINLSKNKKLRVLNCSGNEFGKDDMAISKLDLSQNIKLEELYCSGSRLIQLDLSNNKALKKLVCDNNKLDNLDISENTSLNYINCIENPITTLDLSKNEVLENLICGSSTTALACLDLSNNKSLGYINIINLKPDCIKTLFNSLPVFHNTQERDIGEIHIGNGTSLEAYFEIAKRKKWELYYEEDRED